MTIFAHAAVSILAGKTLRQLKPKDQSGRWILFYAFCGMLPDFPLTLVTLTGNFTPHVHHHEWVFHTPLFWLAIGTLIAFFNRKIAVALLIGGLSHLATDWYGGGDGIMFLWPVNHKQFGILLSGVHGPESFKQYISHPLFLMMEAALFLYLAYESIKAFRKFKSEGPAI